MSTFEAELAPGPPGPPGPPGADGTGVTIAGSVADSGALPAASSVPAGTGYLTADTGHLWVSDGATWTDAGQIQGPPGPQGTAGVGIPTGGAAGQVLTKNTVADYDTGWSTPSGGTGGAPSGPAGGSLTGSYPNPTIANGSITTGMYTTGSVDGNAIGNLQVATGKIANAAVTNIKLATGANGTVKGTTSGTVTDLDATQQTAILNTFTSALKGLTPASGGGTTNYLRGDGTWAVPPGSSGGTAIGTTFSPTGSISATNVQAALAELDGDVTALPTLTTNDTVKVPINTAGGVTTLDVDNLATLADISSGAVATDALWDTKGDLAVATGANAAAKVPAGANGQVLTADSTQTAGVKWASALDPSTTYVRASSDGTPVNNSTTYVNDSTMLLAIEANAVYDFTATIFHDASATADCNIGWVLPAGCTGEYWAHKMLDSATANTLTVSTSVLTAWATGTSCGGVNASPNASTNVVYVRGTLIVGGTAGNIQLKFSQRVATAQDTYRKAGSIMILKRLA